MTQATEQRIPLHALSEAQRRALEHHLPLVPYTLARSFRGAPHRRHSFDRQDLLQEGWLALAEAFLHHEPTRHGHFAAYAMARIRFAVSRYMSENASLLRVPYISRRRRRARAAPGQPTGVISFSCLADRGESCEPADRGSVVAEGRGAHPTLADQIRRRCQLVALAAAKELKRRLRRKPGVDHLIELCYGLRWTIPDAEGRASLRRIADELGCSVGRVAYADSTFQQMVHRRLSNDENLKTLVALARSRPAR